MRSHILTLFQNSGFIAASESSEIEAEKIRIHDANFTGLPRGNKRVLKKSISSEPHDNAFPTYREMWLNYENEWTLFSKAPPEIVRFDSIPFPPCDQDILEFIGRFNSLEQDMKSAYRLACRRFHPDKFMQIFGSVVHASDQERIRSRLTTITQSINTQYAASKRSRRTFSEPRTN
jgi:hypothetical protein